MNCLLTNGVGVASYYNVERLGRKGERGGGDGKIIGGGFGM